MENIKTLISPIRSIWDRDEQWLPPGNYFFTVKKLKSKYVIGTVRHEEGFRSDFEFKITEFIKMMAASQARLARRADFIHEEVPNYPSPPSSPRKHYPNNYVEKEHEEHACAICFEQVKKESDIEYCEKALNCKHQFHRRCIIPWIRSNDTCPVCRKKKKRRRVNNSEDEEEELFPTPTSTELLRTQTLAERLGFGGRLSNRDSLINIIRERQRRTSRNNYVIQTESYI